MRKQRMLTAVLAFLLAMSMALAGCSGGGAATATQAPDAKTTVAPSTQSEAQSPEQEVVKVSWAFWDMAIINYDLAQNAYCREKMGIQIEPIALDWGTWSEQIKLMAATDSMPDVVSTYTVSDMVRLSSWINQGVIRDIPKEMVAKYKSLQSNFDASLPLRGFTNVWDDKYWFMPRTDYAPETHTSHHFGFFFRKDWAEKLGYSGFEAVDDNIITKDMLRQMFIDFTQKDPDGNGADDTYGFTLWGSVDSKLLGSWGVDPTGWFKDTDGKYKPGYINPNVVEALKWFQDLYKIGALDPEFAQNDHKAMIAKAAVQTVGAYWRQIDGYQENIFNAIWESDKELWDDPMSKWGVLASPWVDENTPPRMTNIDDMCGSEIAAHVSDEKLDAILKAQDWMLSKDGQDVKLWGMEGINYNIVDGEKVPLADVAQAEGYILPGFLGLWGNTAYLFDPKVTEYRARQYEDATGMPRDYWLKARDYVTQCNVVRNQYYDPTLKNIEYTFVYTPALEEWAPGFSDKFTQWVITDVDIQKEFDLYVQDLYNKGLQQVIDGVNAAMQ